MALAGQAESLPERVKRLIIVGRNSTTVVYCAWRKTVAGNNICNIED
jgi:hypothetical protein